MCLQDGDPSAPLRPGCIRSGWLPDPERMNAADNVVDLSGSFTLSAGAPVWTGQSPEEGAFITGWTRCVGQLDSYFNLLDFPLDRQSCPLMFESNIDDTQLLWAPAPGVSSTAVPAELRIDGWTKEGVAASVLPQFYPSL